jgi:hypothetical protein
MAIERKTTGGPLLRQISVTAKANKPKDVLEVTRSQKENWRTTEDSLTRLSDDCIEFLNDNNITYSESYGIARLKKNNVVVFSKRKRMIFFDEDGATLLATNNENKQKLRVHQARLMHPSPLWYAAEIVNLVRTIQGCMRAGNYWTAIRWAIKVGRYSIQAGLKGEDDSRGALETSNFFRGKARRKEADRVNEVAQSMAREIWAENPRLPVIAVARRIQGRLSPKRAVRTIRLAISAVRPKKDLPSK